MAKRTKKTTNTAPTGRENVRVRGKSLPTPFPPETCERLRNLAKHANKATTEKARYTTARDAKVEEINACAESETKKLERLKAEGWDIERQITRWHDEGKWARDELIATVENADDLKLIHEPDYADPRPPEPEEDDEDEETPRFQDKPRKGAPPPTDSLPARNGHAPAGGGDQSHWSLQWYRLWREDAAEMPKPTKTYLRDLAKAGIDSPGAFLSAITLNAKENAPLLRNVEPEGEAVKVLRAIEERVRADEVASNPAPAEWTSLLDKYERTLGRERLETLGGMVNGTAEGVAS